MSKFRRLRFSEGETWVINATLKDSDGVVLDLTNASIEWIVAERPGTAAIVTASTGNALVSITDADAGTCTITVPYASHSDATPKTYRHECRVTLDSGEVSVQFEGPLTVTDSLFVV